MRRFKIKAAAFTATLLSDGVIREIMIEFMPDATREDREQATDICPSFDGLAEGRALGFAREHGWKTEFVE